jgi:hypothetical protein
VENNIKMDLKKRMRGCEVYPSGSREGLASGFYENQIEPPSPIKSGEYFRFLSVLWLLKKDSIP